MQVLLPGQAEQGAIRGELPQSEKLRPDKGPFLHRPRVKAAIAAFLGCLVAGGIAFFAYYTKVGRVIEERLARGPFSNTMDIYSAPRRIAIADALTPEELAAQLVRRGYTTNTGNPKGWYAVHRNAVEITPGPASHTGGPACVVEIEGGKIARISAVQNRAKLSEFDLDPQLITNVSQNRERRRMVRFADIPPRLVHAVTSAEDKRFFDHGGFDLRRVLKAAYVDMKNGRRAQGASTLSMQLVRNFWLEPDKRWKRKLQEIILTMHLEHRLTKEQIFEYYANQVYLGRWETFGINGFAEGAKVYFSKDLGQLTDGEAALLAGLVQRPSYYNPFRYPDRARQRRDVVLALMRRNGYLTESGYRAAIAAPLVLHPERAAVEQSHYFVDLVRDEVQNKVEREEQSNAVYTSLDPDLQEAAEAAVRDGMQKVDRLLRGRKGLPPDQPQVALIAMDPHTGLIKALVGGRDYRISQLDHALASRQPGSVFKPFVYAAALNTAVEGGDQVFTPASIVSGAPANFRFEGRDYQPHNFHGELIGDVSLRYALAHSLNIPTVSLAGQVGYDKVVRVAKRMGLNDAIRPTPAVALGAYEATPLEIAAAYTAFANGGVYSSASMLSEVRSADGRVLYHHAPATHVALDPRVAYLMVNMMQEVLRSGTGAAVHSFGVTQPAAGKTGTSRDGWFAGFTSELLCVVWVGFDDNRDLNLEGAKSALPIWAEFMARAGRLPQYRDAKQFQAPDGIRTVKICPDSGELAGPYCPNVRADVFIDGTAPVQQCSRHTEEENVPSVVITPDAARPSSGGEIQP
jgi:penicillin-binding protein 1B